VTRFAFRLHGLPLPKVENAARTWSAQDPEIGAAFERSRGFRTRVACSEAFGLIQLRQAVAMVTAPVSKESLSLGRSNVPGHTEWLAEQTKSPAVAMLMVARKLRTILLTRHLPLSKVASALKSKVIQEGATLGV
jgi:4-hydroxy-L-threonine phosphate dehydrogenase PdxA